jgi:hypothetical protein
MLFWDTFDLHVDVIFLINIQSWFVQEIEIKFHSYLDRQEYSRLVACTEYSYAVFSTLFEKGYSLASPSPSVLEMRELPMLPLQTMFSNSKNPSASRANEAAKPFAWKQTQITFTDLKSLITFSSFSGRNIIVVALRASLLVHRVGQNRPSSLSPSLSPCPSPLYFQCMDVQSYSQFPFSWPVVI